jgi:putative oxidoreductase
MQRPRRICRRSVYPAFCFLLSSRPKSSALSPSSSAGTRITAILLAGYTLLAALVFHTNFADQIEMIMFLKNISIAGGFLLLVANGAGPLSLDRRLAK